MKVRINRDSVSAGDDVDAHDRMLDVADVETLAELVEVVLENYDLPQIAGGRATWCMASRTPIAVVAQGWSEPRMVAWRPGSVADCAIVDGVVRLHFTYLAQIDPALVLEVLRRLHLER